MRLARLLLQAFGPFTDRVLDFAASPVELHLIYGLNEAGKSAALRAMTDLRFGIAQRSPDDFVHPYDRMRIAGVFLGTEGEPIGLIRRKGRGPTLSRFDLETGQPDPTLALLHEHEMALTGGLDRGEFEAMFGLNHARLREGGDRLLKGEGELGSALFEASAGIRGIAAILAALDADAKQIYNPHGRAQNAIINEARRQLDERRQVWRQAQTRPADWQALYRAHEGAKAALAEIDQGLEALRGRENELTELRTVEPLLREHDRVLAELEMLADVPDLSEGAREERLASEQTLRRAQQDQEEAEREIARCTEALGGLVIDAAVLDHGEAIERLAVGIEAAARSRREVRQQQAEIARLDGELTVAAARVAPGRSLQEILEAVPSDADRVALNGCLQEIYRLRERLEGQRKRAEGLDQALKIEADEAPSPPDPVSRQTLVAALRQAQALGDVVRHGAELDRQIREVRGLLTQALSDLGIRSTEALRGMQPLLDTEIARARRELSELDEALRTARDEDLRLGRDLDEQRLRHRQLAAEGEVITAESLRLARQRRDEGWNLIRRAYVELTGDAPDLGLAYDPLRPLPEAFEAAQGEADRQADLLRADAKRAAGYEECIERIAQMDARRSAIRADLAALAARAEDFRAAWAQRLGHAGLPGLEAEALGEWQGRRTHVLELAERLMGLRADSERLVSETTSAASGLIAALKGVGQHPVGIRSGGETSALASLIEQAISWDKSAAATEAEHGARAKAARRQQTERDKVGALIAETDAELRRHVEALELWQARLFVARGSVPEAVKARLDELDGLTRQSGALSDARLRQAHHQAVLDDLAVQAAQLAALLGEPTPAVVEDFGDRLRKRLATARERDQTRNTLIRDCTRAQEKKRQAEAERAAQAAALARLCVAAGVEAIDRLPAREDSAARKRVAQRRLATLGEQLAQASARPQAVLRESLAGQDAIAMEGERERCALEIKHREQDQASARQAEELARRALEAIDTSDRAATARESMESAAARYRAAIRPWARLRLAHALLRETLSRFRESAQAPMVAAASAYFALMTGGRYPRLVADEEEQPPVLRAERADGVRIGVEAMSDGTSDQLYLALRLAALELRRASHPQMPLVLDDVLITSDDERAANILRALAQFSEGGQVMLFTHHRHLIDVARSALGDQALAVHCL